MEKELAAFQETLDAEMNAEQERYQRNISTLGKRKQDMVKSRKENLKVSGAFWDITGRYLLWGMLGYQWRMFVVGHAGISMEDVCCGACWDINGGCLLWGMPG